jgi:hypothetical protein
VLAWRCRTATDEPGQQDFRGVPTFRRGVPVPAADLHAFARDELNLAELDLWLRACLALDWRGVQHNWAADGSVLAIPTLGLLHPLAAGLTPEDAEGDTPRLALRPDWASRLKAGHVRGVHEEAAARLRQVGWEASPWADGTGSGSSGPRLAAALVPRCRARDSHGLLRLLAIPLRDQRDSEAQATNSTNTPAAAEVAAGPTPR